jgi:hypothetical protein
MNVQKRIWFFVCIYTSHAIVSQAYQMICKTNKKKSGDYLYISITLIKYDNAKINAIISYFSAQNIFLIFLPLPETYDVRYLSTINALVCATRTFILWK